MKPNSSLSGHSSGSSTLRTSQLSRQDNFNILIDGSKSTTPTSSHVHAHSSSQQSSPALSPPYNRNNAHCHYMTSPTSQNGRDDVNSLCSSDTDGSSSFERFYMNENFRPRSVDRSPSATSSYALSESGCDVTEGDEHPIVTGMKESRRPVQEMKIVSKDGTVRGVKNRVKGTIASFLKQVDGKPEKVRFVVTSFFICRCVGVFIGVFQVRFQVRVLFYPKFFIELEFSLFLTAAKSTNCFIPPHLEFHTAS